MNWEVLIDQGRALRGFAYVAAPSQKEAIAMAQVQWGRPVKAIRPADGGAAWKRTDLEEVEA